MMQIYEGGYANRKRMYRITFIKGLLAGFGSVIGATLIVAIVLWVLSLLGSVPFIDSIRETIETQQPNGF